MYKTSVGLVIIVTNNAELNLFGYKTIPVEFGEHRSKAILIISSLWAA